MRRSEKSRTLRALTPCLLLMLASASFAQTTQAVTDPDPMKAIALLRSELIDSFNKGDMNRLLSHLDPDIVTTWQNGEVCRGPEGVRAYYQKMMTGDKRVVARLNTNPTIDDRHIYGDWAVSWGNLHDDYLLTDGRTFKLDSRFTATIARRGEEWKVTSFHASVNAFDNPILGIAARRGATAAGATAGIIALILGVALGFVLGRRRNARAA